MIEPCEHYKKPCPFAGGAEDGAWVCYGCSKNTAKGVWPAKESLPVVKVVTINGAAPNANTVAIEAHMARQSPCKGCGG